VIPEGVEDVSAAGIPVAYLTAEIALTLAGFQPGKTVLAPAIGGSVGNAVTQLVRARGAKHAISSTTNHAKAEQAKALGFNEVIDTSSEKLGDGVRRIASGVSYYLLSRRRPGLTPGTLSSVCFNPARSNRSWLRLSRWPRRLMLSVI
jgi:NADPH:quinone reductase-like Zn-dependent oxidoreductase